MNKEAQTRRLSDCCPSLKGAFAACLFLFALDAASAEPVLRCQINQGGEAHVLEAEASLNPYAAKPVMIGKSFQFKAVVFGSKDEIAYVSLYTYARTDRGPALIHEVKYLHPQMPLTAPEPDSLTGRVSVYAPHLGREIQYGCTLLGNAT
jgi:hypothetical protein